MRFLKPLNTKGFGHVELVLAVLFIGLFAFVGVRVMGINHAATLTSSQCSLLGRTFTASSGVCNKVCASGQGSYVVTSTYDYCSGAVTSASKISASTCSSYGRKALISSSVYVGCARRADQKTTAKAPQCANSSYTYYVQSTYDKCAAPTTASVVSCTITVSPKPAVGVTSTYTFTVKNGTNQQLTNVLAEMGSIGQGRGLIKDVMLNTVSAGQTKTVTTSYIPNQYFVTGEGISVQLGTPTSNFSAANGCYKTFTL